MDTDNKALEPVEANAVVATLPNIGDITRAEVIEGFKELLADMEKIENCRFPDMRNTIKHLELHGLPPLKK